MVKSVEGMKDLKRVEVKEEVPGPNGRKNAVWSEAKY